MNDRPGNGGRERRGRLVRAAIFSGIGRGAEKAPGGLQVMIGAASRRKSVSRHWGVGWSAKTDPKLSDDIGNR